MRGRARGGADGAWGRGRGRGVLPFPNFFVSIFVVQFSCTVIFE